MNFEDYKYERDQVFSLGFDPDKLTQIQKDILLEPINAPENYACDGEISPAEAKKRWARRMKQAGFSEIELMNAKREIGI